MSTIITLAAGLVLQLVLYRFLPFRGVNLSIMLMLTLHSGLLKGRERGAVFGFFSGLAEDLLLPGLLGERALFRTLAGWFAGTLRGKVSAGSVFFQFFIFFISYLMQAFFIISLRILFSYPPLSLWYVLLSAAAGGLAAPAVFAAARSTDAG